MFPKVTAQSISAWEQIEFIWKVLMQLLTIKIISKHCLHLQHCFQLCLNKSDFLCHHLQLYFPCICFLLKAVCCEKFKGNAPSFHHFSISSPLWSLIPDTYQKEAESEMILKENYFNAHKDSWGLPLKAKFISVRALMDPAPLCSEKSWLALELPSGAVMHRTQENLCITTRKLNTPQRLHWTGKMKE